MPAKVFILAIGRVGRPEKAESFLRVKSFKAKIPLVFHKPY